MHADPSSRTTVFVVDDHSLVRSALVRHVASATDLTVVGDAATEEEAFSAIVSLVPDVAVLDVNLGQSSGIALCRRLKESQPRTRCLMLTAHDTLEGRQAAMEAGADGFLIKNIRGLGLIEAIRDIARGPSPANP